MNKKDIILILNRLLETDKERKIHLSLSTKRFYNGVMDDFKGVDGFNFIDNKLGNIFILYSQILNIEPMIEK